MQVEIVLAFILLSLSAFFSASEIAFISANKIKLEIKSQKSLTAKIANEFAKKPETFLITILIGNNFVNIALSSILTFVLKTSANSNDFTILILITLLILIFGETIPKTIGRESADGFVLFASLPLKLIYFIFLPVVKILKSTSERILKILKLKTETIEQFFSKKDFEILLKESEMNENIKIEIPFSKVFKLETMPVELAMKPRMEIIGVEKNMSMREIVETFSSSGHSRLPVYDGTIDNIIGIIDVKDLFKNPKNINEILKEPYFVPEKKRCIELLRDFKEKNISMAIVVDEFGGVSGLITLEDVIEELVGEIEDEFDTGKNLIQKVDSNTFILNGLVEIDRLNEEYNLNIPKGDYETISGFVINNIGRIPSKGEEFIINDFKITILNATRTRINSLKLTLLKHHE
ncbi:Hemolysin, contains CBS domains [Candidatus Kryptonium thompsonii]|uniref:Hemolysin, contains CBS domains n=1 Tax=Candidatus Kryptonium thompsonii TaxID=1633631 RepID=A0A0P1LI12_9BACT|nr:hemolysin family protein [Candidatus Kryptonium thompsoni]CUS81407.1 Hemolysin, contains CBS domains [Candidatus Kryptonium thompsoni]CUS81746.1 Hemolysin, contains CBS domains [Candidatus Kryptonium thompsoni]CUS85299.1 Hemolysin, contains CBS domains [Candidatus Kryptonium thompsoni]CUS86776.1 Hemolysin, contains CBS domains [Candidatus Kryptonium thompsoni]CUS90286.1 Hemolysin, contains CBS domains [Candidatus Kryptonium thompsoni]